MRKIALNKEIITTRLTYIEEAIKSLERFKGITFKEFASNPDNFRIAFFDLHRALEAMMDIGSHILSRIPGARATSYKEIPLLLKKHKIIPDEFAENAFLKMAGYRNRMVHFYSEITKKELYNIIQHNLKDFEKFCFYILKIINSPMKYGFSVK